MPNSGRMEPFTPSSPATIPAVATMHDAARMQYRSRPVSVAVDPISLVISECISVTSAIQKHTRSTHSSVSAILGGSPNPIHLGPPSFTAKSRERSSPTSAGTAESSHDAVPNSNRWGLRSPRGRSLQDNPMIAGFGKLRYEIAAIKDILSFDALSLLSPFLLVIQARGTAAPITILALGALRKFLAYGFICPDSPRFALAMQSLSAAVTHCQFDISDSAQGEVVLLMILNLMEDMMSGPGGHILSDESVCDMMGRGLAICSQPRFSPVLRRTAEASMVRMCQIIFEDVKHLEAEAGDDCGNLDRRVQDDMGRVRMEEPARADSSGVPANSTSAMSVDEPPFRTRIDRGPHDDPKPDFAQGVVGEDGDGSAGSGDAESLDLRPYSLPSVRELFRVLVNFLDPNDRQHTDTMRVMAMRILHVALEVSGPFIARHPALATIAEDRLCCYLFQHVRSDNMAVLQESLIVAGTLLATCRGVLKLQQELFLLYLVECLHPTINIPREPSIDPSLYSDVPEAPKLAKQPPSRPGSGRATPVSVKDRQKLGLEGGARKPDARQAMVESIGVLSRMPTFVVELFVNYDCDEDRSDLCEDLIGLLSRNALPDSATWSTTSVPPLCLDALLRYIQFLAERLLDDPAFEGYPDPARLREQRLRKRIIVKGTSKFNEKPKAGISYLEAQGVISNASDPVEVAKFLKGTSRISKSVLGEYLSKKGNESILAAFLDLFDFSGKRLDDAIRLLLETFRLPGEAPLIASIVESFAEKYCSGNTPDEVANKDAVFILTYAIIILNTDQHNPNLKSSKRMTFDDFSRNLRGQNNGQDFSPGYLKEIFDSIRSNEIIVPDEHDNKHAFDYAWREMLLKSESAGKLILCNTNIFDADMFAATWRPLVSALSYVFMSATDDAVFARIVTAFDECARVAAKYGNTEALDQITYSLGLMSTLATDVSSSTSLNTEVQVGDGSSVMVSELAVKLGRNFRAQLATLVLFRVVTGREYLISQGWKHVIRIWRNLFSNSLISSFSSATQFFLPTPSIPLQTPSQVIDRATRSAEAGFFSAFTSYISSYAADDPPEPSEEELESTLCAIDCVKSCEMGNVFANIMDLPAESATSLVLALLDQIPADEPKPVMSVKQDAMTGSSAAETGPPTDIYKYDPSTVYILEFCTVLAIRDATSVDSIGKRVFNTLQGLLRDSGTSHPITISRAVFYSLTILRYSYDRDFTNVPFLLHTISTLPHDVLANTSEIILRGLGACTDEPGPLRSEMMTSPDFWAVLRVLAESAESAALVFDILEKGSTGIPAAIMSDNYEAAVSLLNHFATAAAKTQGTILQGRDAGGQSKNGRPVSGPERDSQVVARACRAINTLHGMTLRIPQLMQQSHLENSEAWSAYWLPLFGALIDQCTNPCREVRQLAFSALQRTLLSLELASTDAKEWTAIFGKVLFPLIISLLKPEIFSSDRDGMSEMRIQAASLLCKVFLQYLVLLSEWDGMLDLWVRVIDIMDRLMNSGQGDSLEEAVRENLKNVVLFMASSGYLVPPARDPSKKELWEETWKRLNRFAPDLQSDLLLEDSEQVPAMEPQEVQEGVIDEASGEEVAENGVAQSGADA